MPVSPIPLATDPALEAPLPVMGGEVLVPLVTGGEVPYAALDHAASTPALRRVWDDVAAYIPYYGSVHRGAGHLSQLSTDLFERSRSTIGEFLGCRADDQVVFTRSTTDSLNLMASAVPPGTRVFLFETEHHAALLPWPEAATTLLPAPGSRFDAVEILAEALAGHDPLTPALVCVTGASNVTGEIWPVAELTEVAHAAGARVLLDAAQLVPHRRVDMRELDVDYLAYSGHKMYAPFGAGVLAGRPDWLRQAEPYLAGGGASRRVTRSDDGLAVEWQQDSARHEAGSPNVVGVHAMASACRALSEAGPEALAAREEALLRRTLRGLAAIPQVEVLSLWGPRSERVGVVSFVVDGWNSSHLAAALSAEHGIGVRDGMFCAHPLVRLLLGSSPDQPDRCGAPEPLAPGERPVNAVRMSFGVGTPVEHVDRFIAAVATLVRDGARCRYRVEEGRCVPVR
ncbi:MULTISPECIES: aminotransferase class V-fold PLP-dependent enzyme [unclassified Streptomyces]|uniref:PauY31 n=1 Tax=Streptomyces sp. YN86 TaxID=1484062 RepID=A0A075F1Q3_9ACTN|nr:MULTISPECIES: aminotransferase class V-fold PLP-dependent enzyme [unclassified Streptomyces]AIE54251.1 PauY31 [Streptomyces sp. YN86]UKL03481.1 aminotransferase class V-fold PLP-dependent enzyme [Streptomyces sp. NBU3104]